MLRESSLANSISPDISVVTNPSVDSRVPAGRELVAFTDAMLTGTDDDVAAARSAVIDVLGTQEMVEAAAVCACLEMMNRYTLATGIPLSRGRMVRTEEVRAAAGLDAFHHD